MKRCTVLMVTLLSLTLSQPVQAADTVTLGSYNGHATMWLDGNVFTPRGPNYIRIDPVTLQGNTFDPGAYDANLTEHDFATMAGYGFTAVRLFVWPTKLGSTTGTGLDQTYIANLTDALRRAQAHGLHVILSTGGLPWTGGYIPASPVPAGYGQDPAPARAKTTSKPRLQDSAAAPFLTSSWTYLTQQSVDAHNRFYDDFFAALHAHNAPMSAVAVYDLTGETGYLLNRYPLNQKGALSTNWGSYNLDVAGEAQRLMDDGLVGYVNAMSAKVHADQPGALTAVQYAPPATDGDANVILASGAAAARIHTDVVALSLYPAFGVTLDAEMASYHFAASTLAQPLFTLETGWLNGNLNGTTIEALGQRSLEWELASCAYAVNGSMYFTWSAGLGYINEEGAMAAVLSRTPSPCIHPAPAPTTRAGGVTVNAVAPTPAPMPVPRAGGAGTSSTTVQPAPLPVRR